ncbi:MAG: energy-coupling factor transporter transmembrane component T family protein [Candidatus Ornithospirochaeta sp.]
MIRDVTLGRYKEGKGVLYELDPRTKLMGLLLYIVSLFVFKTWVGFALTFVFFLVLRYLSHIKFSYMVKGLKSVFFIILFATILNFFLGDRNWIKTIFTLWRMVGAVMASNILTLTTRPREISDALEKGLSFLSVIHFPVHETATIISLAFRFIPILTEEAGRIMDAQKSRGSRIGEGNLKEKASSVLPLLIPLFISAFRRADELAMAMDSRLYGSGNRSVWKKLEYSKIDAMGYILSILILSLVIVERCVL